MKKSLIGSLVSIALAAMVSTSAHAFEPFVVKDIRVEGIQRTEAGTVFGYLPVKVGETMTDDKAAQAIKALFATGFFKDVRLEIEGGVLVVIIEERPAIAAVDFVGMKAFEKDEIKKSLRDVGVAESRIFDRAAVDRAEQELKRQYLSRGYYAVNITSTITPLERNRVGINFAIDEGEIAKIREINIIGNNVFTEKELKESFTLSPPDWLSWYTKNDQYSKQKLAGDLEVLRSYYLDRGYLEFSVDSTQVSISPDKKDIYITINVTEGQKYSVLTVKLAGNLLLPEDELRKLVKVKPGGVYSRADLTETTKLISDRLGNEGYAFANVNAAPELDKEKRQVAFTIYIDPGRRVYVRNINVTGNTRTRDEVVRRELRQMESAWYDGDKINKSRTRVDRLGYFDEVTVETPAVPGTTDQVDMNVNVKEKPTGSLMLGAGFLAQKKFRYRGLFLRLIYLVAVKRLVSASIRAKLIPFTRSHTDPYYTVDGVSAGFDIYRRDLDTSSLAIASYQSKSTGGGLRLGLPITDEDYINGGLAVDSTQLTVDSTSPVLYQNYVAQHGGSFSSLIASAGWSRNTVDSRTYPRTGTIARITADVAVPPGSLEYYRLDAQHQHYWPISKNYTLFTNAEISRADGFGGKELPFFKNYYAGGIGSVRGYDTSTLGPIDAASGERIGGNRQLIGNLELLFPMPGSGVDKSVRLGTFLDGGQVWGADEKMRIGDMRFSSGLSLTWNSPMGPLKFSIAQPLNNKPEDKLQRLQFSFGNVF